MNQNLKVVILCGGLGTRLKEETEYRPKPMVEIGGRPILWHIMKIYSHYGFKDFTLCLGYKGEMIKEYFHNYGILNNDFTIELGKRKVEFHNTHEEVDWKITLVNTGGNALKGARLKRVEKYIDSDTFMTTYGDGVANINIHDLLAFHNSHGKIATLTGVMPSSRFGTLSIDGNNVIKFIEKPQAKEGLINGGFFVFNKRIFDYLTNDDSCDLEIGTLDKLAEEGELMVYKHLGDWMCMDTIRDLEYLNKLWASDKAFWINYL
ncbi:MAG: glucose-1-phosphate cytidylyltransferase [Methanosarcinaceae archaeon]